MLTTRNKKSTFDIVANNLISDFAQSRPMHANTLLLSIFGDSVYPYYNGRLWVGSLIKLVEPLGINQRLVRTAVFRLSGKKILVPQRVGKRSYYILTPSGKRQCESASKRIYVANIPQWDGHWRMIIHSLGNLTEDQHKALRKELIWLGFSRLVQGTYIHPTADIKVVRAMLEDLQISEQVVTLYASEQTKQANYLIKQWINIQAMEVPYSAFVEKFQPIADVVENTKNLDPQTCFLLRALLINEYRVILMHEPELPAELSSKTSIAHQARQIAKKLYLRVRAQSDAYFLKVTKPENSMQSLPSSYNQRFIEDDVKESY